MSREMRRVPANWDHPRDSCTGRLIPLFEGGALERDLYSYAADPSEWGDVPPNPAGYMPVWNSEQATHFMMYETTSEGTPVSPAFATPEDLARWLTDTGASAFANMTASYTAWLRVARGVAPGVSLAYSPTTGVMQSGVEAMTKPGVGS